MRGRSSWESDDVPVLPQTVPGYLRLASIHCFESHDMYILGWWMVRGHIERSITYELMSICVMVDHMAGKRSVLGSSLI